MTTDLPPPQHPPSFNETKQRINQSLEYLRTQLTELRAQDVSLLKQMMHINCTISSLSGKQGMLKRSFSSGNSLHHGYSTPDVSLWCDTMSPLALSQNPSFSSYSHSLKHNTSFREFDEDDLLPTQRERSWSYTPYAHSQSFDGDLCGSLTPVNSPMVGRKGPLTAISESNLECPHLPLQARPSNESNCSETDGMTSKCDVEVDGEVNPTDKPPRKERFTSQLIRFPSRDLVVHSGVILDRQSSISSSTSSDHSECGGELDRDSNGHDFSQQAFTRVPERGAESRCSSGDYEPVKVTGDHMEQPEKTRKSGLERKKSGLEQYEIPYEDMLKRSSKLWREIQEEHTETGKVDNRKMIALKLFL